MAKKKRWSYNAGERGTNWVRAYEDGEGGVLYLEWRENGKRTRLSLGTRDRKQAVVKAEELAERFGEMEEVRRGPLTLRSLFTLYLEEITPTKAETTQAHDRLAARMYQAYYGAKVDPAKLGRRHYNAFIRDRRAGKVPEVPQKPVRNRAIERDVRFLLAVFNWATVEREDGTVLLQRNPWKGFPVPKETNPRRVPLTEEAEEKLLEHSPNWRFRLALILCRETGRRLSAVLQLRWSDVDLAAGTVRWEATHDKNRRGRVTPLPPRALQALREVPRGIGDAPVFPAPRKPEEPVSKDTMEGWLAKAKRAAGLEVPGLGFHSGKRSRVRDRDFRELPAAIQEALVDTNHETLRKVYDEVTLDDLRTALGRRQTG